MRRLLISALAVLLLASTALAQASADPATWSTAQKRAWLRSQIAARVADPDQLRDAVAKLDRMSDEQLDALIAAGRTNSQEQAKLAAARAELAQSIAMRNQLAQQVQAAQAYGRGAVGYRPIITTLPQGASLSAGAVISPDRRYVRINAAPFFSSIGPVRTFNFRNGYTGYYPQYVPQNPYGPYAYGSGYGLYNPDGTYRSSAPQPHYQAPRVWFDGVRTRVGR